MKSIRIVFIAATVLALTLTTNAGGFRGGGCGGGFRGGGCFGGGWGLGFSGCGWGVSLGLGWPGYYGGCGYYGCAPVYSAPVYAAPAYAGPVYSTPAYTAVAYARPVYSRPVYTTAVYATTPGYVRARTMTYSAPVYAKAISPSPRTVARVTYAPVQATQAWTLQPARQTGPTYNWTTPPSTTPQSPTLPNTTAYYAAAR